MIRQPITKKQRRLGIRVFPKVDKYMARRSYAPGMHGPTKMGRQPSEYAIQLKEKQKAKFIYGLNERQFENVFKMAKKFGQQVADQLLILLERRLDNVLYRAGLAKTRPQARQWINHGLIQVNDCLVKQPSFLISDGHRVKIRSRQIKVPDKGEAIPSWLKVDPKNKSFIVNRIPRRDDIVTELQEQYIVEYYSR